MRDLRSRRLPCVFVLRVVVALALLAICSHLHVLLVNADEEVFDGVDPDLVFTPDDRIDFPGCFKDLATSDRNGDGFVKVDEYLGFIQEFGIRVCYTTDRLSLQQRSAFNTLACICASVEGNPLDCCVGDNARILTTGATSASRTQTQLDYLVSVCRVTYATMDFGCTGYPRQIDTLPPIFFIPQSQNEDEGIASWWNYVAAILAALLLLLLLCCCCCVAIQRRRQKYLEEDEEVVKEVKAIKDDNTDPEAGKREITDEEIDTKIIEEEELEDGAKEVPQDRETREIVTYEDHELPPTMISVPAEGEEDEEVLEEVFYDEEEEYEDGQRRRGGGNVGGDDEDGARRIRGAGRLPPDQDPDPDRLKLRPVPPKDPAENPDWDYPGRDINFPKPDPDEYSAGKYEPYHPDGGVNIPQRPTKDPVTYGRKWERGDKDDPDDMDDRKHRIQSGLGEGDLWTKLDEKSEGFSPASAPKSDAFDWVVQSALGVLDSNDELEINEEGT